MKGSFLLALFGTCVIMWGFWEVMRWLAIFALVVILFAVLKKAFIG